MRRMIPVGVLLSVLCAFAAPARAQRIEITPFVGYQFGGELAELGDEPVTRELEQSTDWGLMLDVDVTVFDQVEFAWISQGTELNRSPASPVDVTIDSYQIGALHHYAPNRPVNPYIGLTLGATRFDVAGDSDTKFSGTVALGVKMLVSDHLGFRFDGRIMGISTGSDAIGCVDDVCFGYPDESIIWQYGLNAGVIIHFGRR